MKFSNIKYNDLLIRSEYLLDDVILRFGDLIPTSDKQIERIYYCLEHTPEEIQKIVITKEEFEQSPKYDFYFLNDEIEGNYSSLNYEDFSDDFDFKEWDYAFLTFINETFLNEFLLSVREQFAGLSDTQSKMFFQSLLQELNFSEYFLEEFMQTSGCDAIRKTVCGSFKIFNKELFDSLRSEYEFIFPELLDKYGLNRIIDVEEIKSNRLRNTDLYKFGCLFANGTFSILQGKDVKLLMYDGVQFDNANEFSIQYSKYFGFKHNSFSSYIRQTLNDFAPKNNIFHKDNFKYVELIYHDFTEQKKPIAPFFKEKYQKLLQLIEQD
ncbi:hypothetical protein CQ046_08550 [Chryseobacterium sp. MYb7]|uniref:hypothetical protein n=1 Tax=Chryseobacterium sp. MYb7 TaxID=1827290 RepID=UPI000CFF6B91|nr:hypothetical protein [Chryseobacterium sp. MYb7]PRB03832.1 hypothetical protein CQ046_08550 [Chryseobacterium sp. MYb7]